MREPIPVDELVRQVCDDGADFNDGVGGWTSGMFDPKTQLLTLTFEWDEDDPGYDEDDPGYDEGEDYGPATYTFSLIPPETLAVVKKMLASSEEEQMSIMRQVIDEAEAALAEARAELAAESEVAA